MDWLSLYFKDKGIIPFSNSFHPEFKGYIGLEGDGVWISSMISRHQGRGSFSKLLKELKEKYAWIKIPTPSNRMVSIALRKGFFLKKEYFPEPFNEWGEVLVWKKEWEK